MSDNEKLVVIIFFAILIAGYMRLFFPIKSRGQKFIQKAKESGNYTTGKYVKHTYRQGNRESGDSTFRYDSKTVTYEYTVDGEKYYKKMRFQSPGMVNVEFPVKVTVYYNPRNPRKSVCPEEAKPDRNWGCLGIILFDVLLCIILLQLLKNL